MRYYYTVSDDLLYKVLIRAWEQWANPGISHVNERISLSHILTRLVSTKKPSNQDAICLPTKYHCGFKNWTAKTLHLNSGNGQFKVTIEIHNFDKHTYLKYTKGVKTDFNLVCTVSFMGFL